MRALMRSLAPDRFEDVAALVALYRPGPMAANMHNDYADRKNGRKPVEYLHPDAEEILGDTYGLMIYQESVMRMAQKFAGYSLAEADNLRKACGKKIRELMAKEREKFVDGCEAHRLRRATSAREWFDIIEPFADYAFNKSHSYGYGFVAYQTAYLKANYPVEYLAGAAHQRQDATSTRRRSTSTSAAPWASRSLVPDVNVSGVGLHARSSIAEDGGDSASIPFGLSAVRNVGEGLVDLIVAERDANGPFADFFDFCERVDTDGAQQADHRVAHQGRGLRLARSSPPGPAGRVRGDRRPDRGPAPRARHGRHVAVRRAPTTSDAVVRRADRRSPTSSSTRRSGWRSRRRCSASTSPTTR